MKKVKCHLSRLLGEKRMKMSELTAKTGLAQNTVISLYHERAKGVTFEVVEKICNALDCDISDLFGLVDE